jgi:hypothetical protein
MKVYKLEILIIDHDQLGEEEIKVVIENQKYPNYCISPTVMDTKCNDIGEWSDDHPLNNFKEMKNEYSKLFKSE